MKNKKSGSALGRQDKEWMGCFLEDLRAFGINADQWTTAAQIIPWRNGSLQRKSRLDYGMQSSYAPERDGKDQEEDSSKQAGSCWFARPC